MKNPRIVLVAATAAAVSVLAACQEAPITGRRQLVLVSDQQAAQLGAQAYQQILSKSEVSKDPQMTATVRRVADRLKAVIGKADGKEWQFTLFKDDTANAWALPGGHVGVNTGMFRAAKTEAQLAAVLSHEIAHVMANHSAERMSQQMVMQTGLQGLGAAGGGSYVQIAAAAAQLGVILPFSRTHEAEADQIGLHYMAQAGYDPREAIALWENMEKAGGKGPPQFLSTHPSPGNRIENIRAELPKVMPIYERARR